MLTNATITAVLTPGTPDPGGVIAYTSAAVSARAAVDEATQSQRWVLGATIKDADRVVYVLKDELTGVTLDAGMRLTVLVDRGTSATFEIVYVRERTLGGGDVDHWEVFAKKS
jgi:hypothetical protein